MSLRRFLFVLGITWQILMPAGSAKGEADQDLKPILKEVQHKLEATIGGSRRPFKFKGMNDSLQLTLDALKLLHLTEAEKTLPMSVWPSTGPLTPVGSFGGMNQSQKRAIRLLEKAQKAYPKNTVVLAIKANILSDAGETAQANRLWEEYLSDSQEYSSFNREMISQDQFDRVRSYAQKILRSRGIDFHAVEKQRLSQLPIHERLWYFATHIEPQEQKLNRVFLGCLAGGVIFLILCSFARMDYYRALIFSLASLYAAVWVAYGCWIYDRAFGLPWGLDRVKVMAVVFGFAAIVSLQEVWTAWRYANPRLDDGYRRCPHCKKIIVQLSVECEHCRKKIA